MYILSTTVQWDMQLHNIYRVGHMSLNNFLEAALRPWMDSDKNFADKKNCLGIYLLKII